MEEHTAVVTPSLAPPPEIVDKIVIGGDLAGVQELPEHHREGLTLDAYEVIKQRPQERKAAKKEERRVARRGRAILHPLLAGLHCQDLTANKKSCQNAFHHRAACRLVREPSHRRVIHLTPGDHRSAHRRVGKTN